MEKNPLSHRSLQTIHAQIERLEAIDLRAVSINELKPLIKELVKGFPIIKATFPLKTTYRARKADQSDLVQASQNLFSNVSQLWYPPKEYITKLGRLNKIGEQIFYCCNNLDTALIEVRPEVGDVVTILECQLREDHVPIAMLWGMFEYAYRNHPGGDLANLRSKFLTKKEDEDKYLVIHSFLEKKFTQLVEPGHEHNYKITVAIAEWLMGDEFIDIGEQRPPADGISYESIAWYQGSNLALKPDAADRLYEAISAQVFYVTQKTSPMELQAQLLTQSNSIESDGTIKWDYGLLYHNRGSLRRELGDNKGAIDDSMLAITFGRTDALVYQNIGYARGNLGDYAGEEEALTEAVRLGASNKEIFSRRGLDRYWQGKYADAVSDLAEAIARDVDDPRTFFARGIARYYLGDYNGAFDDFLEAVQKGMDEPIVYQLMAEANLRRNSNA